MRGEFVPPIGILIEDERQQRAATLLRDVAYVIEAHFEVLPPYIMTKGGAEVSKADCEKKHLNCFSRRASTGQCFHQPCLGSREFPVRFELLEPAAAIPSTELPPEQLHRDLGWMLHDISYLPADKKAKDSFLTGQGNRVRAEPRFFKAKIENGVIDVHKCLNDNPTTA